jgi:hypothetical protein
MNKVEVYIDTDGAEELNLQRLELFKDEQINITQTLKNSRDISKVFSDYTQDFTLPASKTNKRVFKFVENSDVIGGVSVGKKFKGEIRLNGETFKRGYFIFRDATFKMGVVTSYKIYFVSGLGRLKTAIGEAKISNLDYSGLNISVLQDFNSVKDGLQRDRDNLRAGETDTTNPDSYESMLYSLIMTESGHYYSENWSEPVITDFKKNLAYNASTGSRPSQVVNGLAYNNIKPSLRMNTIIRAIENDSLFFADGKSIRFSNDFFNNTLNKDWFNLFMLMHNKKGNVKSTENSGRSLISGWTETTTHSSGDTDGVNVSFSNNVLTEIDISSGSMVLGLDTNVLFVRNLSVNKIIFSFTPTSNDVEYEIFAKNPFDSSDDLLSVTDGAVKGAKDRIIENPDPTFEAVNGSEGFLYRFYAKSNEPVSINCSVTVDWKYTGVQNDCKFEADVTLGSQQSIAPSTLLPEMKVKDFLKGVFNMFNLVGYEDVDGTIVVDTYDSYKSTGNTHDITKYVDDTSVNMSLKMPYNNIDLSYKESEFKNYTTRSKETIGNSFVGASISGSNAAAFGGSRVNSSVDSADSSFELELPFQLMEYSRLKHSTTELSSGNAFDLITNIQIGELVDFDNKEKDAKGIIYYPITVSQSSSTSDVHGGLAINDSSVTSELTTFNIPSNTLQLHSRNTSGSETQSLWFTQGKSAWSGVVAREGLYDNYHFNYVEPFFISRNRRLKVTSYLPMYMLKTITLRDTIVYKNKEYRINSLKSNLQTGKTDVELEGFVVKDRQVLLPVAKGDSPVITITGSNPVTLSYGSTYTDSGATATDTEDGNLTSSLTDDSSSINTSSLSRQLVTYSVTDSDGNTTEAEREVNVEDTSLPSIDTWSTNSINQTTGEVEMNFTVSSSGSPISKCEFYVFKQGESEPLEPSEIKYSSTGTFDWFGEGGTVYEVFVIAFNGANSTRSSNLTVNILPLT